MYVYIYIYIYIYIFIHADDFRRFYKQATKIYQLMYCNVKVCIFWKCIHYTIHWDKAQMLKSFPQIKYTVQKIPYFFLSRAQTHHSFTFNLWFLHELKHKACLSLWDFLLSIPFCFLLKFIFMFNKMHGLLYLKAS